MGPWYRTLGRGDGESVVDGTPYVARGHSRETTYQQDLTERAAIEQAALALLSGALDDVAAEGRPVIGLALKVRYAPFTTKTFTRKIVSTSDRDAVIAEATTLISKIDPDRAVRLLGMRAEMAMPEDAREGHTPTRSGW
jgi:DNA polymerase-4